MAFHGFHAKDQSNKKRDLLPLFTLHDFMFSEKKMKKLLKLIEDYFECTQRSDELEQIHNTPEKIMKYADRREGRKDCFRRGNRNSCSLWMKTLFLQSHSAIQCRILIILLKSLMMKKNSVILILEPLSVASNLISMCVCALSTCLHYRSDLATKVHVIISYFVVQCRIQFPINIE